MKLTNFDPYPYHVWTVSASGTEPWEGWYEIYEADHKTSRSGPKKLPHLFPTKDAAHAAAEAEVRREIEHSEHSAGG
ncbi:hypothetical protein [Paraherbaspirillum soli]|uniref:DUF2188 domain-containing protein n=1 Tax=Paraherbaspirillum soli TaxID=631222 RepID=A0ABW0MC70_9BURK